LREPASGATLTARVPVVVLQDTFRDENVELSSSVSRGPRSEAALTVLRGENTGALYPLQGTESIIGRDPEVCVPLPDTNLSRQHARIVRTDNVYTIEDLGSTNGTFVDGERVERARVLEDGCRVHLGTRTVLHFRLYDAVELEAARATYALTVRDPLTGTFNRRYLQERLWSEAAFARRHQTPLSLVLLDIDHFKRINDEYGHAVGDSALRALATALSALTRQEDVLARYGGEEFALIARGIDREKTLALAERMRRTIEEQRLPTTRGSLSFTVSVGIAHSDVGEEIQAQQLFEAADRALYAAKDAGRNAVSIAPPGI
jgi:two-component system cell cycle response regulator